MGNASQSNEVVWDISALAQQALGAKSPEVTKEGSLVKNMPNKSYIEMILNSKGSSPGCQSYRSYTSIMFSLFVEWMEARGTAALHASGDRRPWRFGLWFMAYLDMKGYQVLMNQDLGDRYKGDVEWVYDVSRMMVEEGAEIFDQSRCGVCPDCRGQREVIGTIPTDPQGMQHVDSGISQYMEDMKNESTIEIPEDEDEEEDELEDIASEF